MQTFEEFLKCIIFYQLKSRALGKSSLKMNTVEETIQSLSSRKELKGLKIVVPQKVRRLVTEVDKSIGEKNQSPAPRCIADSLVETIVSTIRAKNEQNEWETEMSGRCRISSEE
ncbi:hypothetical protein H920_15402 [Fukomys damarensis]|uniref:Uncharacterized protein n=1 Tax=Fukomys damarensis TaxID=885580 RepID=A0A091CX33_FUKDA|nr:hypothetical protein H920_15402 [Fukomys damarensis]